MAQSGTLFRPLLNLTLSKEKMANKCEVYFGLRGDNFDPKEITDIIGIEPTKGKQKADAIPKNSYWNYSLGKIENGIIDVYELSSKLVSILQPLENNILKAIKKHNLRAALEVVIWFSTDEEISTPAIGFDETTIQFLNSIGATIDIDTYLIK
jgi:hypothetical protein